MNLTLLDHPGRHCGEGQGGLADGVNGVMHRLIVSTYCVCTTEGYARVIRNFTIQKSNN